MKSLLLALLLADVSGHVYTPDGAPVEGAVVRAGNASVKTNKDGAFTLSDLAEGVVELDVDGKKHPLVLTGDVVSITLDEDAQRPSPSPQQGEGTVKGKVTADGKPLANAPVIVGETRVLTNAKGEYVAKGVEIAAHTVTLDERLFPRLRWLNEPPTADLHKARDATVDLALLSAPMMRGRVVDADGKPVARARVHLVLANRSTLEFTDEPSPVRTTPDGRYAFPAPGWGEREQVSVAVTPLLHSTYRSKPFALGAEDRTIDITLPKLESVRIRVLDRAGEPIPKARVTFASDVDLSAFESARWILERDVDERLPRTNDAGELVVQLAADTYDFAVAAKGFQSGAVTKTITKPATVSITLDREALLRGRVHRGERGVANVTVNININAGRLRNMFFATDADGKFEINGLAPGTYRVTFSKAEELIQRSMDVEAPGDVDVALPLTGTLRARVIDGATGTPVSDFAYEVESAQTRNSTQSNVSTPDGTFTVEIPAGTYRVTVGAPSFTMSAPAEVRVVENDTTNIDVPLSRGATITGRVVDESGLPVAGADVMIMPPSYERTRSAARFGPPQMQTADDGTFTVTGIDAGEAQMTVQKQGYVMHRRTVDAVGTMSVDVTLTRGLSIHGIVTRGGKPVARAQVVAVSPAIGGDNQATVSDEDGRFTISGLIRARYSVSAFLEEQRTEVRDVDPTKQKEIVLSLDGQERGVVYGIITGAPPAAAGKYTRRVVMVHSEDGNAEGMIDDAGNYRIENAPTGNVSVIAVVETSTRSARTSMRKQVEVIAGQTLRVDLELAGNLRVSGRVTVDGKPIVAQVGFASEEGTMASALTGDDGTYELLLTAPGRYQIYARAEQVHERHFQIMRDIRGGETIDIDLREQLLEGTVVDAVTRQPIDGALVTLAPMAMASIIAETQTDASGRFQFVMAGTGSLRLIAAAHGYAQRTLPVSSSTSQFAFELSPAADLRIRVLDARTNAPLDGYVVFSDENGILPVRPRRSTDGTTFIFSLAPGKYRAMAIVQDYTPKTVEVTAPGAADIIVE